MAPGVYAKLEYVHPTRSAKYRALVPHLRQLVRTGELSGSHEVIIRSAGCAAVTTAWACREIGLHCLAVIPEHAEAAVSAALAALGAQVHRLATEEATLFMQQAAADPAVHVVDQFQDPRVVDYYRPMAAEILQQLPEAAAIFAGIGTGASIMGMANEVHDRGAACRLMGVWPAEFDPSWATPWCAHGITGLAPPVRETHLRRERIDAIVQVPSVAAQQRAEQLFLKLGLPAGVSSGATLEAALELQQSGLDGPLVCIFASACNSDMPTIPPKADQPTEAS